MRRTTTVAAAEASDGRVAPAGFQLGGPLVFAPLVAGLDFGDHVMASEIKLWFIILMAVNLQTSFLTPPFGFALFYLKGIAPREIKITSIYKGIIPFVLLQVVGLIMIMWKPEIALWLQRSVYE